MSEKTFLQIFEDELSLYGIVWCTGCEKYNSHKRGFAISKAREIHYDSKIATRATLHGGLHEIGHIVANTPSMRRWEQEASAEAWANKRMAELGISIPRKVRREGKAYVARMKRWGNNIAAGRK